MTTARSIINDAFREGNIIALGDVPQDVENTEALLRLNKFFRAVYGYELGEQLIDWEVPAPQRRAPVAANYPQLPYPGNADPGILTLPLSSAVPSSVWPYPPLNSRIVWGGTTDTTVYFPESPSDGARMSVILGPQADVVSVLTLDGNGRLIEGAASKAQPVPVIAKTWFYRADIGNWQLIADVALDDEMPFPTEFDDLWITLLAVRLAPRFDKTVAPATTQVVTAALARLKARYRQRGTSVYGSYDMPRALQSFAAGRWWL